MCLNNYSAIIFDLDGCLLDTSEGIKESVVHTLSQFGIDLENNTDVIDRFIGPPIQNSLKSYCGFSESQAQEGANIFRNYYKEKALLKASVYPGLSDVLQQLKSLGVNTAVATYKREDYAKTILDSFGLSQYFNVIHGADNFNRLTKRDIIESCIAEMHVDKSGTVMIGDTFHDYNGAKEVGVKFIGVSWGFGFRETDRFNEPMFLGLAQSPVDILSILAIGNNK